MDTCSRAALTVAKTKTETNDSQYSHQQGKWRDELVSCTLRLSEGQACT